MTDRIGGIPGIVEGLKLDIPGHELIKLLKEAASLRIERALAREKAAERVEAEAKQIERDDPDAAGKLGTGVPTSNVYNNRLSILEDHRTQARLRRQEAARLMFYSQHLSEHLMYRLDTDEVRDLIQ